MANIKSAEKRMRQIAKSTLRNRTARTKLRTATKKYREIEDAAKAEALSTAHSEIDVAWRKGIIHKNAAARYKSRLAKRAKTS